MSAVRALLREGGGGEGGGGEGGGEGDGGGGDGGGIDGSGGGGVDGSGGGGGGGEDGSGGEGGGGEGGGDGGDGGGGDGSGDGGDWGGGDVGGVLQWLVATRPRTMCTSFILVVSLRRRPVKFLVASVAVLHVMFRGRTSFNLFWGSVHVHGYFGGMWMRSHVRTEGSLTPTRGPTFWTLAPFLAAMPNSVGPTCRNLASSAKPKNRTLFNTYYL